jgi:hypothetical protein
MKRVATSVEIAVPPATVFAVLTNFAAYHEWCPFFVEVRGEPRIGSRLEFDMRSPTGARRTTRAELTELDAPGRVAWRGGLPLGLFRGVHTFEIVQSGGHALVHDVERFWGLLVPVMLNAERLELQRQGFLAFDQALKQRCEQLDEVAA